MSDEIEPTRIGFWPKDRITWPIDRSWDPAERDMVVAFLLHPKQRIGYRGCSHCRICGCVNGSADFTDGHVTWPSGLAHYLIDHHARAPEALVEYVRSRRST